MTKRITPEDVRHVESAAYEKLPPSLKAWLRRLADQMEADEAELTALNRVQKLASLNGDEIDGRLRGCRFGWWPLEKGFDTYERTSMSSTRHIDRLQIGRPETDHPYIDAWLVLPLKCLPLVIAVIEEAEKGG